jgi:hypothetical protein
MLPQHLQLQEESPVLRVTCETISNGEETRQKIVSTDANLEADVMKTLQKFGLRAVTRKNLINLLRERTGRYGFLRTYDDQTNAYVGVSVSPDPVIAAQVFVGNKESRDMSLQTDFPQRIDNFLAKSRVPADVQEAVIALLAQKENFEEPVRFDQKEEEKEVIAVRIGYVNTGAFLTDPPMNKKKR